MTQDEKEAIRLSFEGLALANLYVTKQLVVALVDKGVLSQEEMQRVFESAITSLQGATASVSGEQAEYIMGLIWGGFSASGDAQKH